MSAASHGSEHTYTDAVPQVYQPKALQTLDIQRQTKYFLRCLKSLLPTHYTPTDSNRMALAFYIISGLDLLNALDSNTSSEERSGYIDWVYHCQHPHGGFRGFTGGAGSPDDSASTTDWDPANMSATYFGLCLLLILGDDLSRVKRSQCAEWLTKLQRPDGAFGESIVDGRIRGGHDARFGYCAAGISYILGLDRALIDGISLPEQKRLPIVDKDAFVKSIHATQTYDGGIAGRRYQEAHAGFTFCAIAALHLFDRLPHPTPTSTTAQSSMIDTIDINQTIHWLTSRQTNEIYKPSENNDEDHDDRTNDTTTTHDDHDDYHDEFTGFNGRTNKLADTCYAFWAAGALSVLGRTDLVHRASMLGWLTQKTSHGIMGGFGKHVGDLPDLHHSYLGLATCAMFGVEGLTGLDAAMCISERAKGRLESVWRDTWQLEQGAL